MRFTLLILSVFCISVWAENNPRSIEKKIVDKLLDSNVYDSEFRPYGKNTSLPWGGPVKVKVQIFVRQLYALDDNKREYQVQLTVRQRWYDDRLNYTDPGVGINFLRLGNTERIWTPDLFFSNDIEADQQDIFGPNELVRIYPDGNVMYSTRITLRLSCQMEFRAFPFDGQKCSIVIPSYGYTTEDLVINWEDPPIHISKHIHPDKFSLEKFSTGSCQSATATGEYSCIRVSFLFKRLYGYYQVQVYMPTSMMVIISWLTFWLDHKKVTARVAMALINLLTMAVYVANFNSTVPVVSYTKALDVWTGVCLTFSFGALIEFVIVHYLSTKRDRSTGDDPSNENEKAGKATTTNRTRFCCNIWPLVSTPEGLDLVSRMIYPLVFVLFNIIYWTAYAFAFGHIEAEFNESLDAIAPYSTGHH